jgi:hypothetical protein
VARVLPPVCPPHPPGSRIPSMLLAPDPLLARERLAAPWRMAVSDEDLLLDLHVPALDDLLIPAAMRLLPRHPEAGDADGLRREDPASLVRAPVSVRTDRHGLRIREEVSEPITEGGHDLGASS